MNLPIRMTISSALIATLAFHTQVFAEETDPDTEVQRVCPQLEGESQDEGSVGFGGDQIEEFSHELKVPSHPFGSD